MIFRLCPLLLLFLLNACATSRHADKQDDTPFVNLDTIVVTASRYNPYRASATKYFDLEHTKLQVSFDYAKQYLYGKATITLRPHFYPQSKLVLDAKGFDIHEVSKVTADNKRLPLPYIYDSLQLNISLDSTYTRQDKLTIYVDYTAKPEERKSRGSAAITSDKGLYFINPLGTDSTKPIQIWTQGETESNSCWFPTIDKPDQKTTEEIYITRLKKYVSLSNGELVATTENGDSTATDYWRMDLPHAPYLFMLAVGDFAIVKDRWRDVPVTYYVERPYAPYAQKIFGNTPEMMEFFSQKLGFDFPWQKYAQIVVRDYVSGAMENTSATLHGEFLNLTPRDMIDRTHEDIIAHELFHQWFGDLVTCESWSNVTLNEGFATYGEYLWNEYKYGREYADNVQYNDYEQFLNEAETKNVDLIRFYYNDKEDMFDSHSYAKGGLVLHYLRHVVGDDAFFKSLNLYLKTNQFKTVEIHQLRLAFEEVTGRDMNWFFNEWFLNSGYPQLTFHYSYTADSICVAVTQKQNTDKGLVYTLPMNLAIHYGDSVETYPIELNRKSQTFSFAKHGTPDLIDADADRSVLCTKTENKSVDNYVFQYNHCSLYRQRFEALTALADSQKTNRAANKLFVEALNDNFFSLRQTAIEQLYLPQESGDSLLAKIARLAVDDSSSHVRVVAINRLAKDSNAVQFIHLFERAAGDSSYMVASAALRALIDLDSSAALRFAKGFEQDKNETLTAAVAAVYARNGDVSKQDYFRAKLQTTTGYAKYSLLYYYANFLTRMDKPVVLSGIADMEAAMQQVKSLFLLSAAKGAIKRIVKSFSTKKKKAEADLNRKKIGEEHKEELRKKIADCDQIISAADKALERLGKVNGNPAH